MPGLDNGSVAAAVPYSWEAAPGKPISGILSESTEPRAPLPPPPGLRKPHTYVVEPVFVGFEPEPQELHSKLSGPHFAEKLFKKLQTKLQRKKSKVLLSASSSVENLRMLSEHKKRTSSSVGGESEAASASMYDSDERQSDTPCSAESSVCMSSMGSMSSLSNASTSWESFGHNVTLHQDGSERSIDMILAMSASEFQDDEGVEGCLSGPRESAWHEDSEPDEELTEQEWQIVRYASLQGDNPSLISTLVRQSSLTPVSEHSYRLSPAKGRVVVL